MPIHNTGVSHKDFRLMEVFVQASRNEIEVDHLLKQLYPDAEINVNENGVILLGDGSVSVYYCAQRQRNRTELTGEQEEVTLEINGELKTFTRRVRSLRSPAGTQFRFYVFDTDMVIQSTQRSTGFSVVLDSDEFRKHQQSMKNAADAPKMELREIYPDAVKRMEFFILRDPAQLEPEPEEERDPD